MFDGQRAGTLRGMSSVLKVKITAFLDNSQVNTTVLITEMIGYDSVLRRLGCIRSSSKLC